MLSFNLHPLPWVLGDLGLVGLVPGLREVSEGAEIWLEGRTSWEQGCGEQTGRLHQKACSKVDTCSALMADAGSSLEVKPQVDLRGNPWQKRTQSVQHQTRTVKHYGGL